eukprot:TRINITY_DN24642_c0_g1_i2.p1 TRINITY_DN24642_c0_g1~~TRINITY_DN24642_c0_g1_i2.p1  ORF type:complete len:521 (-),score=120.21 TRINITY_DN24642_c0_g1_i2:152-1714(-)
MSGAPRECVAQSAPLPLIAPKSNLLLGRERTNSAPLPTSHKLQAQRQDSYWVAQSTSQSFFFAGDDESQDADQGLKRSHVIVNLVKCAVGAGSFSLPAAFTTVGMEFGIVSLIVFGVVAAYTMTLLADAEKRVIAERSESLLEVENGQIDHKSLEEAAEGKDPSRLTYPELMKALFPELRIYIPRIGLDRNVAGDIVTFAIILTSIGVSVAYALFIGTSLHGKPFNWDGTWIMAGLLVPMGLLAQLRSFKYLAFTSVLGDVAVTAGVVGTIAIGLSDGRSITWPHTDAIKVVGTEFGGVARGLATISFLFLVHIMTLPMTQSLKSDLERPKDWHFVAHVSYAFIGLLNLLFTVLAVCIFWDDDGGIASPVTNNLGDGAGPTTIKLLLCVDLLFTIPMIMAVGREVIENSFLSPTATDHLTELKRTVVRIIYVLVVAGLGLGAIKSSGINNAFNDVLGLIGGLTNTMVGLILPPFALHRAIRSPLSNPARIGGFVISAVGLALLGTSTYYTMHDIIHPAKK